MAVTNKLLKQEQPKSLKISFKSGDEEVTLSPLVIRNYLVNGDAKNVTDQEVMMFMMLCKHQHLNPFLREAYLIKYGTNPATIVTGKAAFEKRANRCEAYEGFEAGIVVINLDGELEYRPGTLVINGEQLVGGWADVFVRNFRKPVRAVVSLEEYIGRKKGGEINSQWSQKPATMIRKVAKTQALREAFPEDLQGLYSAEEVGADVLPDEQMQPPIEIPEEREPRYAPPEDEFSAIMKE